MSLFYSDYSADYRSGKTDLLRSMTPAARQTVDLTAGEALWDTGTATLISFQTAFGTHDDGTLIGNAATNTLSGGSGDDHIEGRVGDDSLEGDVGFDFLDGDSEQMNASPANRPELRGPRGCAERTDEIRPARCRSFPKVGPVIEDLEVGEGSRCVTGGQQAVRAFSIHWTNS
jgi:Ca2+-binding RTX toxin-like protein